MPDNNPIDKLLRAGIAVYVVMLVLALYPYTPDPANDIKTLITHWAATIFPMPLLGAAVFLNRPLRRPKLLFWPFLLVVVLNAVACFLSPYAGHSLSKVSYLLSLFVLYLVASQVYTTPGQVRRLMVVVCGAVALSSIYALFQKIGLDPFPWDEKMLVLDEYLNLPGTFGNPNVAGHTLVLAIVITGYLISEKRGRWCILLAALFLIHLLFTHHRAGLLATSFSLVVLVVAKAKPLWNPWSIPIRTAAVLGIVLAGIAGFYAMTGSRDSGQAGIAPLDGSILNRYNANYSAARMIAEKPLIGYGPNNYKIVNPDFWTEYEQQFFASKRVMNYHVHNEFLQSAVDAGLPAAAAYLGLLIAGGCAGFMMIRHRAESVYRRLGLFYALFFLAFLIDGLFGFNFGSPVSGALLALFAGTLEGIRMPAPKSETDEPPRISVAVAAVASAAVLALTANAVLASYTFESRALLQRAKGAIQWEYFDQADALLARAERFAPYSWEIRFHRGTISSEKGDQAGAIQHYEQSLACNPTYIRVLYALAQSTFNSATSAAGQQDPSLLERSEAYARRIQEICPMLPDSETLMGYIALYRASLLTDTTPDQAALTKANIEEAQQYLKSALKHGAEGSAHLYNALARSYFLQDDLDAAFDAYGLAVEHSPTRIDIWISYYSLARTLNRRSIYRENFRTAYDTLMKSDEDVPLLLAAVASAWLETPEDTGRAAAFLGAATRDLGDTPLTPTQRAELSWATAFVLDAFAAAPPSGAIAFVINDFTAALPSDADAGSAHLSVGVTLLRIGESARAEIMLARAVPLLTGSEKFFAMGRLADVMIDLDRGDEAESMLRDAVFENLRESELRLIFARFLAKRGKTSQAVFEFNDILQSFLFEEATRAALVEELAKLQEPQ